MKQTFDTDDIIFGILKNSPIEKEITGGIYVLGERPDNSEAEDIVVNTIDLTQDCKPQLGVSNVNIYASDIDVKINKKPQKKASRKRLRELSTQVLEALRAAKVEGLAFVVKNQTTIKEQALAQHYVNIRIEWSIH